MLINQNEYLSMLSDIRNDIRCSQHKAMLSANQTMIAHYWRIGQAINAHKAWGNKFIDVLSNDIRQDFPQAKGYSVRNLKYMAKLAETYSYEFVQQAVAQIPWGHNIVIMEKVHSEEERAWYIGKTVENAWSRDVLVHQIESKLYQRQVLAPKVSNFPVRLPAPTSELAVQTIKDPYIFDFVSMTENMVERDIEAALVNDVTHLLLELGTGFAFLGHQYHLNVGGDDFYIDLLFYNLQLRSYIVVELKTGDFKPEYAGQINFYLSAVDSQLKTEYDNPSIGLLLCKSKNNLVAEYALRDMSKPIGVSEYKLTGILPDVLEDRLPSPEDIQNRIGKQEYPQILTCDLHTLCRSLSFYPKEQTMAYTMSIYEKETVILYNQSRDPINITTYDPSLQRRLAEYADKYPDHCRRLDKGKYPDYVEYEIDKDRLSVRLLPPMSEEKRKAASVQAKANGLGKRRME